MSSDEIREAFLAYFERQGHQRVPSSSLIPRADPSLLFVNAGMVQFKDVFLGRDQRPYSRATTSQKCVRAGGKHNDLDSVGRTARHHTFFEMLGNFSFGDYFKREAIKYAWEFLTGTLALPKHRLWITVFEDDDEALALWQDVAGVSRDRILKLGEHDNFWAMGDTGPCGPCSEILVDRGEELRCDAVECGIGKCDCDRWCEIWNLVFMQFNRDASGTLTSLPRPSIDTGMGLERITSILAGVHSNYDTDLLRPLIARVQALSGVPYHTDERGFPHRVIADHARACTFLIADGVLPGNEGRGYVLRRIMRRAIRFGRKIGLEGLFMGAAAQTVIERMGEAFPDLWEKSEFVLRVIGLEEERFGQTLGIGTAMLQGKITEILERGHTISAFAAGAAKDTNDQQFAHIANVPITEKVPGDWAFRLYDTYGFPYELTEEIASEYGLDVDRAGFDAEMDRQRDRARAAQRGDAGGHAAFADYEQIPLPATEFLGYRTVSGEARIESLATRNGPVEEASEGDEVEVVLDRTPFYGEGGGQVGDRGALLSADASITVEDTVRAGRGLTIHRGRVERGRIAVNDSIQATVDASRRADIARNHTATHLLHAALRRVLGPHVRQAGSLVAPDRLRFDFSHIAPMSREEMAEVQRLVNEWVRANGLVRPRESSYQDAIGEGALAFFDEKYGERVRIVEVQRPENGRPHVTALAELGPTFSKELCGGTHCGSTGEIGFCYIVSESSIGAGMRRIEAVTGRAAEELIGQRFTLVEDIARRVGASPHDLPAKVEGVLENLEAERRRAQQLQREMTRRWVEELAQGAGEAGGVRLVAARVEAPDFDTLREMADQLRDKLGSCAVVLGATFGNRPNFLAAATKDLTQRGVNAGQLVKEIAAVTGGSGGGRADMAQAGGRDTSKLDEALQRVPAILQGQVSGRPSTDRT